MTKRDFEKRVQTLPSETREEICHLLDEAFFIINSAELLLINNGWNYQETKIINIDDLPVLSDARYLNIAIVMLKTIFKVPDHD